MHVEIAGIDLSVVRRGGTGVRGVEERPVEAALERCNECVVVRDPIILRIARFPENAGKISPGILPRNSCPLCIDLDTLICEGTAVA